MKKRDFDQAARTWDDKPGRLELAAQIAAGIRRAVELRPTMTVLDFGCGTGLITLALCSEVASVTGADSSPGMLEELQVKCREQGINNVDLRLLDHEAGLDFAGSYDLIVSSMTFHHVADVPRLLTQMYALTTPGGHIAIADLDEEGGLFHEDPAGVHHNGFSRQVLAEWLQAAGYTGVKTCTVAQPRKTGADGALRNFNVFLAAGAKTPPQG